jgi:hypothetical protein
MGWNPHKEEEGWGRGTGTYQDPLWTADNWVTTSWVSGCPPKRTLRKKITWELIMGWEAGAWGEGQSWDGVFLESLSFKTNNILRGCLTCCSISTAGPWSPSFESNFPFHIVSGERNWLCFPPWHKSLSLWLSYQVSVSLCSNWLFDQIYYQRLDSQTSKHHKCMWHLVTLSWEMPI